MSRTSLSLEVLQRRVQATILESVFMSSLLAFASTCFSLGLSAELRQQWVLVVGVRVMTTMAAGIGVKVFFERTIPTLEGLGDSRLKLVDATRDKAIVELEGMGFRQAKMVVVGATLAGLTGVIFLRLAAQLTLTAELVYFLSSVVFAPLIGLFVSARLDVLTQSLIEWFSLNGSPAKVVSVVSKVGFRLELAFLVSTMFWMVLSLIPVGLVAVTHLNALAATLSVINDPVLWRARALSELGSLSALLAAITLPCIFGAVRSAWLLGALVAQPMSSMAQQAEEFIDSGQAPHWMVGGQGEVWWVLRAFLALVEKSERFLNEMRSASTHIDRASTSLKSISARFEKGASEQAQALHETSTTTEELLQAAGHIAENAAVVQGFAANTSQATAEGSASAESFREAVERIAREDAAMVRALLRLTERVAQIGRTLELINTVARRSELLALSADLEGTRAGEAGRNFSRVAAEMRRLAENVLDSTKDVALLVAEVQHEVKETGETAKVSSARLASSATLSSQIIAALQGARKSAKETADAARAISLSTQQQQTGTDQLAEAMADVLGTTQQSLYSVEQLTVANSRIESVVKRLHALSGFWGAKSPAKR